VLGGPEQELDHKLTDVGVRHEVRFDFNQQAQRLAHLLAHLRASVLVQREQPLQELRQVDNKRVGAPEDKLPHTVDRSGTCLRHGVREEGDELGDHPIEHVSVSLVAQRVVMVLANKDQGGERSVVGVTLLVQHGQQRRHNLPHWDDVQECCDDLACDHAAAAVCVREDGGYACLDEAEDVGVDPAVLQLDGVLELEARELPELHRGLGHLAEDQQHVAPEVGHLALGRIQHLESLDMPLVVGGVCACLQELPHLV